VSRSLRSPRVAQALTDFLGTEDTILFPSCMDANAGVFEAILTKEDVMISDRLVHASIVDGMRLCAAERDTFPTLPTKTARGSFL
jgi:glycine C-acetyltransferase